ncbi:MAG: universal stress protein [Desulfobacterales bacterium]|nr:universal stress protein [Desulfobacterales bacterium]
MFNKVLAATDLLEACDAAVLTALDIAKQNNAKLYILHVLESAYSGKYRHFVKHFKTGDEIVSNEEYEATVKEQIDKQCAGALKPYGNYEIAARAGFPYGEILRLARAERVDLIVLGPHAGRAEEKGVVRVSGTIGSTVEGVIMHERCPVMVVNRIVQKERLNFKKALVSIDFSKSCEYALQFAIKLAQRYGSKIFIFHMGAAPPSPRYPQAELEAEVAALKKRLEEFCKEIPEGIDYELSVWEGTQPYLEILKYAREKDVDIIAMGSHTKEKGEKWYVGSAVEQVSSRSVCPVAVITDPKALLKMEG